ncbi:chemokine XC receptor 1 [Aplochiton taeniatus]
MEDFSNLTATPVDYYFFGAYDYNDPSLVILDEQFGSSFPIVCYSLVICLSLPGNSFLLWVLLGKGSEHRLATDFLLLNLTTSDLLFTLTLPFWAVYHARGWVFGEWACKIASGVFYLGLYSYMAFLAAMTLDRYMAVVHAVSVSAQARLRSAHLTSTGLWLFCVLSSILEGFYSETRRDYDVTLCVSVQQNAVTKLAGYVFQISLFFLLPFAVIVFCYVRMWATVRRCRLRGRRQALGLMLGIVAGFFVCWAPYNALLVLQFLQLLGLPVGADGDLHNLYLISHTLAYSHCCLNPLFHVFGGERFRRHLPLGCGGANGRGRSDTFSPPVSDQRHPSGSTSRLTHL